MLKYISITTHSNAIFTQPCNGFANVFNVFACRGNYNITIIRFSQFLCQFFRAISYSFCRRCFIVSIYLSIVYAPHAFLCKVFLLQTIAANECSHFA